MATLYVSPTGSGLRDGSSIENAGTIASLNKYIAAAGPGGQVLLLADQGAYQQNTQLSITKGGTDGAPVTIRGIDSSGNPMAAEIVGSRPASWTAGMSEGSELFRLMTGANNLVFEDLNVKNVGNGVFRAGADISNLTIRDVNATNVSRFIEDYASGTNTSATINGLTVQNVNVTGYSQNAIRLQYDTHNVTIENVIGDSQHQDGGLYVSGVALAGTVHDVLIAHTTMMNNYGHGTASEYWNGDGFSTERGVYNVRFEDTVASGNTDAGYDLKSSNTTLVRAVSEGNNRNYRFWSDSISMVDSSSIDPVKSGGNATTVHVWLAQNANVSIDGLTFSDALLPHTLFDLTQGGATLHLTNTVIPLVYQTLMLLMNGSVIDTNAAPTGLAMSGGTVQENAAAGTWVASLSAIDPDAGDSHTFTLVGGATDLFEIVGSDIRVKAGAVLDFETQQSYGLTVEVADQGGQCCSQTVTINLIDVADSNAAPTGLTMSGGSVVENAAAGTWVGSLSAIDPDAGDTHTFTLTGGATNLFEIVGSDIRVKAAAVLDYELQRSYGLTVQVTDQAGLSCIGSLTINLSDVVETGTVGNDVLAGGAGGDRLAGGAGNDTYTVNAAGDVIVEALNQGTDLVNATIPSYTLAANVENLTFIGSGDFAGTGNGLFNAITGGAGNDTLRGGAGNDTIHGGAGNDQIYGGIQNDKLYGDAGDDYLRGEDGRDTLSGWLGNDVLEGGAGNDSMGGGAGNDTYIVDSIGDTVWELSGEGTDTVQSSVTYTLGSYVENLTLTGANAINSTGNSSSNKLIGNSASNVLSGGSGNDVIDGGAGNDMLVGGQGADTYLMGVGSGIDTISNSDTDLGADKIMFSAGITEDQLWFARSGSDLVVSVLGTGDRATLQGWFSSTSNQLDHFELSDGATLAASQVQQLLDAMSAFVTPPANLADLSATQQQAVETVIASNWHSAG